MRASNSLKKNEIILPTPRAVRLRSSRDVRRLLAAVINGVLRGTFDEGRAGKVGFLANVLLKACEQSEIEQRLERLEQEFGISKGETWAR